LYSLGYSGGLKSCEKQLGINRSGDFADIDGYFAVLLWEEYKKNNNKKALETLLSYNIEDVLSLEKLMVISYNKKLRYIPLSVSNIEPSSLPNNPFEVHSPTVRKVKKNLNTWRFNIC